MIVELYLKETSQRIVFKNVKNAYTKGDLYCVYTEDGWVYKYPLSGIFNVRESYYEEPKKKQLLTEQNNVCVVCGKDEINCVC